MACVAAVLVCCCFRFRVPRTKQRIEADHRRRHIAAQFRRQLATIQDSRMDTISLKDALELLHAGSTSCATPTGSRPGSGAGASPSNSPDASPHGAPQPEPQASGLSFVKFATKVAHLSKLGQPAPATPPARRHEAHS